MEIELRVEQVVHGLVSVRESNWGGEQISIVEARELHQFLEVKTDFKNWVSRRIKEYDFQENQDYRISVKNDLNSRGRPLKQYELTLDMAKELAMVERNEKGRQARKYFIKCERLLFAKDPHVSAASSPRLGQPDAVERFLMGIDDRSPLAKLADAARQAKSLVTDLGVKEEEATEAVRQLLSKYCDFDVDQLQTNESLDPETEGGEVQ